MPKPTGYRISYDNSTIAMLKGRERKLTREFLRLQSHYLFQKHFCLVRRPNENGHVERLIGFARHNFLVPVSQVDSREVLNDSLHQRCVVDLAERTRGKPAPKIELLREDPAAFPKNCAQSRMKNFQADTKVIQVQSRILAVQLWSQIKIVNADPTAKGQLIGEPFFLVNGHEPFSILSKCGA